MKIDIMLQHTCSDTKISAQAARRARFALSRFGASIQSVRIRTTDINGPKGGVDTRCVVSVKLAPGGEVVVQCECENIFSALNHCLSRVGRAIHRNLERRRDTPIRLNRRRAAVEFESFRPLNEQGELS